MPKALYAMDYNKGKDSLNVGLIPYMKRLKREIMAKHIARLQGSLTRFFSQFGSSGHLIMVIMESCSYQQGLSRYQGDNKQGKVVKFCLGQGGDM